MKTILIISYYFPPFRGVGAKRVSSLSKELLALGYHVIVVKSADDTYGAQMDSTLEERSDNLEILDINAKYSFVNNLVRNSGKFARIVEEIILKTKIEFLFITGGPFFYFPLGRYIKSKYNIPYILDYRDNYFLPSSTIKSYLNKLIFKFLWDKPSLKSATYIINVTPSLTELHRKENPNVDSKKFITIFNGYEDISLKSASIKLQKSIALKNVFKIGIFGKFYYYNPDDVRTLLNSLKAVNFEVKIFLLGEIEEDFYKLISGSPLEKNFEFMGYLSYSNGLSILKQMDCLILNNREPYALGTKIFDYVYVNKPIIAFAEEESEIGRFLGFFENSFIISSAQKDIANVWSIIRDKKLNCLDSNKKRLQIYSRSYQFKELINKIKSISRNEN